MRKSYWVNVRVQLVVELRDSLPDKIPQGSREWINSLSSAPINATTPTFRYLPMTIGHCRSAVMEKPNVPFGNIINLRQLLKMCVTK
jgi:hypothetical protein